MSQKKRGLGKGLGDMGLSELLGDMKVAKASVATAIARSGELEKTGSTLQEVDVDKIRAGRYQPRRQFDQASLEELAQSIRAQGIIQPIILRRMNDGFEIIAGERRWRAAQLAQLKSVPAVVRDIPDQAAMAMALIENIQRSDLNAIEEATALQRLILEFELTHQEIADAVGKSRALVSNLLRLLKLNPDVRVLVENGQLEMGHARALLALTGGQQSEAAKEVVAKHLSVRHTEELVQRLQNASPAQTKKTRLDPNIRKLQQELSERLGAEVSLQHGPKGAGKLVVHYHSLEELDGILEKL